MRTEYSTPTKEDVYLHKSPRTTRGYLHIRREFSENLHYTYMFDT